LGTPRSEVKEDMSGGGYPTALARVVFAEVLNLAPVPYHLRSSRCVTRICTKVIAATSKKMIVEMAAANPNC
jgi:hypothetical protein